MSDVSQHPSTFTQRALKWTMFLAATALVVYFCLLIVRPFLNVIAWSSVLVITFHPVHQRLVRKTGRVSLSAFVCSVMVVVAFVIPLLFITAVAIDQFVALGASLQQMFTDETGLKAGAPLRQAYEWLSDRLGLDAAAIVAWVRQNASELTRVVAGYTLAAAQNVAGRRRVVRLRHLRDVSAVPRRRPDRREDSRSASLRTGTKRSVARSGTRRHLRQRVWRRRHRGRPGCALRRDLLDPRDSIRRAVGHGHRGDECASSGRCGWSLGARRRVLAATGHWTRAIILAVFGTAVISTVDNFLRPRLVGGRVGLSELVMFFSLLGGLQVFGVLGIVLGPVLFAIAAAILDVLSDETAMSGGAKTQSVDARS